MTSHQPDPGNSSARELARQALIAEFAEWDAEDARAAGAADDDVEHEWPRASRPARERKPSGASTVYSIRLGPDEVQQLQRRADVVNLPPTMLARQFIRMGLRAEDDADGEDETVDALVDRLKRDSSALHRILTTEPR